MQNIREDLIPHYHGDIVRILFVTTAALSFFSIPLFGHLLPKFGTLFEVAGGILLIALAGLTNPYGRHIMTLNIIVSGIGTFLFELTAISYREYDSIQLLIIREIGVLLLISALYFSVKTARAMAQGTAQPIEQFQPVETMQEKDNW